MSVVVAGNALVMKRDGVALNGVSAVEMLSVSGNLSRYGRAEVAWSFVFPASAAKIGINEVAFKPGVGTGDTIWVEVDVPAGIGCVR